MQHTVVALSGTLLLATVAIAGQPSLECDSAALQAKAPTGTTILGAKTVSATDKLPAHCLVDANVATPGNVVDFRVALPTEWNDKFLFVGVGGFAGSMGRLDSGLQRGYATATTDTGHKGRSGTDGSWALNYRPKEIDYGHRGTHVSAIAAQQLTKEFYGTKAKYAYFSGCSNGGRQALMEAQRYPNDFDGIVAGDPSFGAMGYVRRGLNYQYMLASLGRVLTPAKVELLSKAVTAACDASDGLVDGLVGDPRNCKFDPQVLLCKDQDRADCLTAEQIASVNYVYHDVSLADGTVLRGMPVGHEAGDTGWRLWITGKKPPTVQDDNRLWYDDTNSPVGFRFADGFFRYLAFEQDDPDYDWRRFDVNRDLHRIATIVPILSPTDSNLNRFAKSGKKLLLYHGWADPALSAYGTLDYYNNVVSAAGGKQHADDFVRLFFAPGMHHCSGGPGPNSFDTLSALERWVEQGKAPDKLIASHSTDGKVDRTRPLCPEPQVAKYAGTGSIDDAGNFRCEAPTK